MDCLTKVRGPHVVVGCAHVSSVLSAVPRDMLLEIVAWMYPTDHHQQSVVLHDRKRSMVIMSSAIVLLFTGRPVYAWSGAARTLKFCLVCLH